MKRGRGGGVMETSTSSVTGAAKRANLSRGCRHRQIELHRFGLPAILRFTRRAWLIRSDTRRYGSDTELVHHTHYHVRRHREAGLSP